MPTNEEIMQQALDGLDDYYVTTPEGKALVEALRTRLAQPEPEPESNESDEIAHLQNELYLLAREMVYKGNSVAYIYNKMMAYRSGIDAAWNALRANGIHPDGSTSLSEAIAKHTAPPQRETMENGMTEQETNATMSVAGLSKPVIDKTMAKRIATQLGWEPKREWQGLTDEEVKDVVLNNPTAGFALFSFVRDDVKTSEFRQAVDALARAIEAKLREKNSA